MRHMETALINSLVRRIDKTLQPLRLLAFSHIRRTNGLGTALKRGLKDGGKRACMSRLHYELARRRDLRQGQGPLEVFISRR